MVLRKMYELTDKQYQKGYTYNPRNNTPSNITSDSFKLKRSHFDILMAKQRYNGKPFNLVQFSAQNKAKILLLPANQRAQIA